MPDMLSSFMRMANLFGPQQNSSPPEQIPLIQRAPQFPSQLPYDENVTAQVEPEPPAPQSTLDAFRESVLHPPVREHMTYPKSTLNGLTKALEIASTPTDYEKNRVYVDGQAYQQAKAWKDPATGQTKFINKYKQPGFMEQVMKAMPAAVSAGADVANQPYADAVADWEMKNKGLGAAATAEANAALANQRNATAGYTAQRPGLEQQKIDISADRVSVSRMTAEERVRASQLNTMTDREKLQMLQDGRISIADMNNAAAMERVNAQQAGATERTGMQQTGANQRTDATIAGANQRNEATNAASIERTHVAGAEARQTKGTPSANAGMTSQLPTQQIKAHQLRANEGIQTNPKWRNWLSIDQNGMVEIEPPSEHWYDSGPTHKEYDDMVAWMRGEQAAAPINQPTVQPATPPTKAPGSSKMPAPQTKAAPGSASVIPMTTPDGKGVRMVPEAQVQTALQQGYKYKTAGK